MLYHILRAIIAGLVVVAVAELSRRHPRAGALLLSLPQLSILAFLFAYAQHRDVPAIARLSRETLILVPISLPFFIPLALAPRLGLGFWPAFFMGIALASLCIGLWLWLAPDRL